MSRKSRELIQNNGREATESHKFGRPALGYLLASLAIFMLAFEVYRPALHGQFVFDDLFLTYTQPHAATTPLAAWCGLRPMLGLSFWTDFRLWGLDTFPYHVTNVLFHCCSAILLFFIVRKLLELSGTTGEKNLLLSSFSAILFLLHPAQTEAVAYIASRSENLSVLFLFGALCMFLYRPSKEIGWGAAGVVLLLFCCAISTKEHSIALPAVLLLTDYFFNPGFRLRGIIANWRLYVPFLLGACGAGLLVWKYVSRDPMIGFHIQGLSWYQYFFTECRAVLSYVGVFLFPLCLNADHDFPVSFSLFDHGAYLALFALVALVYIALYRRRRFPLAAFGFLTFLILLAPTSSVVPIRDVFVERRLYLPFIGLLLVLLEPLRRLKVQTGSLAGILACVCAFASYLTWQRAHVWNDPISLWEDTVAKSPNKVRARIGLGNAYVHQHRCGDAVREYEAASRLTRPDFTLHYNLAAAYACLQQNEVAARLLKQAIADNPKAAPSYALLGKILAEEREWQEGLDSLMRAEQIDPGYAPAHAYRGAILAKLGRHDLAGQEFEACLRIDPNNAIAKQGWANLTQGETQ